MKEIMATPAAEDLKTTYGSVRASLMRLQEQVARVSEHYPQSLYPSNGTFLEILVRDLGKVAFVAEQAETSVSAEIGSANGETVTL